MHSESILFSLSANTSSDVLTGRLMTRFETLFSVRYATRVLERHAPLWQRAGRVRSWRSESADAKGSEADPAERAGSRSRAPGVGLRKKAAQPRPDQADVVEGAQ